jgi:hypothetical protein
MYGENLEDLKLEELSQKLEAIEKDNEQIRRENQLFESYILRKTIRGLMMSTRKIKARRREANKLRRH